MLDHRLVTTSLLRDGSASPAASLGLTAWLAYAHFDTSFYVAEGPSSVDVVSNSSVVATIPVGNAPFGVAVDETSQRVFVANSGSDNVSVIAGSNNTVVASVSVQADPTGIACDPTDGLVYVADTNASNVTVISESTLSVVGTVGVDAGPLGLTWDPASDQVFVADHDANTVTVIDGATHRAVATLPVGAGPYGVAVDNATDEVYVTNEGSNNVSVISASTNALTTSIPVPAEGIDLQGVAYDSVHRVIWLAAGSLWAVAINATSNRVVDYLYMDPAGAAFDPDSGSVCFTNSANSTFACFDFGSAPLDPASPLFFNETGLPAGTTWGVTVQWAGDTGASTTGTTNSTTVRFDAFCVSGGAFCNYTYTVGVPSGYAPSPRTGYVWLSPTGATTVAVTYSSSPGSFAVQFNESGLPSGTRWSVTLGSTTTATNVSNVTFLVGTGTYPYRVGDVPGWHQQDLAYSGEIVVLGAAVDEPTMNFYRVVYNLGFTVTGLAPGQQWTLSLNGTNTSTTASALFFPEPNGSYPYALGAIPGLYASPASGTATVAGADLDVAIAFLAIPPPPTYNVTFRETGLPKGTGWGVVIGSKISTSLGSSVTFSDLTNGSYGYVILAQPGYVTNYSGIVDVNGSDATVNVTFAPQTFPVIIIEFGLPNGTNWTVTVTNSSGYSVTQNSSAPAVVFYLPNGTYTISVSASGGYSASGIPASVVVAGESPTSPVIGFSPAPRYGGVPLVFYVAAGAGAAAVAAAVAGLLLLRRRRVPPPPS